MAKNFLFLSIFNFVSLCTAFLIMPFHKKVFDYGNSPEALQLIKDGSIAEALSKAEQFGYKSGHGGYQSFVTLVFVVMAINFITLFIAYRKMKVKN